MPTPNKDDIVFSLDMDGCIFNPYYNILRLLELEKHGATISAEREIEILYAANKESFDDLIDIAASYKRIHFILGTARQDFYNDWYLCQRNKSMSCFHAIEAIVKYFEEKLPDKKVILHKYILADTFGSVEIGISFDRALDTLNGKTAPKHEVTENDTTKFTLLYSQLNYFSRALDERPFDFWFVDDNEKILLPLHGFFCKHPDLIPQIAHLHTKASSHTYNAKANVKNNNIVDIKDHEYLTVDERNLKKVWFYNKLPLSKRSAPLAHIEYNLLS